MRLPKSILTPFENETGISANQISAYLGDRKTMSKSRAIVLEKASTRLGYEFQASDWMFNPNKIKNQLIERSNQEAA